MKLPSFSMCGLCAAVVLVLSACSGPAAQRSLPGQPAPQPAALAGIPFPADRLAAALTDNIINGADAEQASAGAAPSGTTMLLDASSGGSGTGGTEWALYRFATGPGMAQVSVSVQLNSASSTAAFVGLANYGKQRWDFSGPISSNITLPTGSNDYVSPGGSVWIAVAVPAGERATVSGLNVRTDNPANFFPTAVLETDSLKVSPGAVVQLRAGASSDFDGSISNFEWDLDGDGLFNEAGDEATAQGSDQVDLMLAAEPGLLDVAVRVTDNEGAQDTAGLTLTRVGWLIVNVEANVPSNAVCSLALINGKPAISFGSSSNSLHYAYSSTSDGSSGWTSVVIDDSNSGSTASSLALINGKPAVSFADFPTSLKYAYSSQDDGSSGWTLVTIDDNNSESAYSSLALINGKPAISFGDWSNAIQYAYSTTDDGSSGWTIVTVDDNNSGSAISSLALINGKPAISFGDWSNALHYAYSSTDDGSSGWTIVTVDDNNSGNTFSSLALINGKPAISFGDPSNALHFAYSSEDNGSSGWTIVTVDDSNSGNARNSLAVINGLPAISYGDWTNTLNLASSSAADGSSGWTSDIADGSNSGSAHNSLAEINGRAAISYTDGGGGINYAVLFN